MKSIQSKLILIITVGLLVTISLTGFVIFKYDELATSMAVLSDKTSRIKDSSFTAQISFKTQIQEWKNTLLRGYDEKLYSKYHNSFLLYEEETIQEVNRLIVFAAEYPELQNNAREFIKEHKRLGVLYRKGLSIYDTTENDPQISADKSVRGIDRKPIKLLSHIVELSKIIYKEEVSRREENLAKIKFTAISTYIITFFILILFLWFSIKIGVAQPFKKETTRNHRLAMTDGLTKVANRHAYNERIATEIGYYRNHKTPLSLLVFDLDEFKSINDTYGHKAGDKVIKGTAEILKNNIRSNDFVARYGGEEFVVLLPSTAIDRSEALANKLRELIEYNEYFFNNVKVPVTVSVGIAEIKMNETDKELFERADAALYKAKKSGRNKCFTAE